MRQGWHAGLPVARYLRPEEAVVPFRFRPELSEMLAWCTGGERTRVRLLTGDGGIGKTRLALRLGQELTAAGWQPLWVPRGAEQEGVGAVRTVGQPCVLVVDYAETRADLGDLIGEMSTIRDGPLLRVVLLARSAGEWWDQLRASMEGRAAALLEGDAPVALGPVRAAGGPQEVFAEAVAAFAQKMGTGRPDSRLVVSDLDPVVLVVHAAALLAVADYAAGTGLGDQVVPGAGVLEGLLQHEARYWVRSAAGRSLDLDVSVLRLAVALGCLIGADDQTDAVALLGRIPDLDSAERRGRVARWLHDLYPTARQKDVKRGEWLGPLRPDRLAEQFIASELEGRPELIASWFTGLDQARTARALTVMARAALTQEPTVVRLLSVALAADLDHLAVPALSVAVETNPVLGELLSQVLGAQPVSRETLTQVAEECPYPSLALASAAAVALRRLADDPIDDSDRSGNLLNLALRLEELGQLEQALAAIEQAVTIRRQLALDRPGEFLPDLAHSLSNQSHPLARLGRHQEALASIMRAQGIYRQLASDQPGEFLPYLADSFHHQSQCLAELGRHEEALTASEQASGIYRELAKDRPGTFLPTLAISLDNQSQCLRDLGRREDALAANDQATAICRELAASEPDTALSDLAHLLHTRCNLLAGLGRQEDALAAIEQAVAIRRQLVQDRPDAGLPALAASLDYQSFQLAAAGRQEDALTAIEQATVIYRRLAAARPEAFLPDLADSLNDLAVILSSLGRDTDASVARLEAEAAHERAQNSGKRRT